MNDLPVGAGDRIELSEACSSVGQLEARAGEGLALAPLTNRCVMDLPAGVGEVEGCRHFFTNGGLGCLGGTAPRIALSILPCLGPPGVEAFSFWLGADAPLHSLGALAACGWAAVPISASYLFRWIR